jgi:hypothetical protein
MRLSDLFLGLQFQQIAKSNNCGTAVFCLFSDLTYKKVLQFFEFQSKNENAIEGFSKWLLGGNEDWMKPTKKCERGAFILWVDEVAFGGHNGSQRRHGGAWRNLAVLEACDGNHIITEIWSFIRLAMGIASVRQKKGLFWMLAMGHGKSGGTPQKSIFESCH